MGPTFAKLTNLKYSLGITPIFSNQYYYEDSSSVIHMRPLLHVNDSVGLVNIFLLVIVIPVVMGVVFKVVALKSFKDTS